MMWDYSQIGAIIHLFLYFKQFTNTKFPTIPHLNFFKNIFEQFLKNIRLCINKGVQGLEPLHSE